MKIHQVGAALWRKTPRVVPKAVVDFPWKPLCAVLALCWLGASLCACAEPQSHDRPRDPGKASSDSATPGLSEKEKEKKGGAPASPPPAPTPKRRAIRIGAVRDESPPPIAPLSPLDSEKGKE